jgi:hypothetical protein
VSHGALSPVASLTAVSREDLAIIRLLATSAHAFMGKSRLDSPRPGAIYTPWCCVAFGQEATRLDRRSTSMALSVAMRAVATLALLLALVLPAAAQPLRPALKQAQCPVGSMQSGGYCAPLLRNAPPSTEKRGLVPRSPLIPGKAFRLSPYPPF